MMKHMRFTLLMSTALLLAACGFHLRPPAHLPAAMQHTYIADSGNDTELVRELRRTLTTPTTSVTTDVTTATAVFNILSANRFQRVLSVSNTGQPLEYQVAYQVQFSVTAGGKTLVEPQKLTLTNTYSYSATNVLGDTEQAKTLYKALQDQMVQLIMLRIEAVAKKTHMQGSI